MWGVRRDTLLCMVRSFALTALLLSFGAVAQTPPPVPAAALHSREVNADHTITFRYAAPAAVDVRLSIDAFPKPLAMSKDAGGVWSVTTPVLPAEFYGYKFIEDGVTKLDPMNGHTIPNYVSLGDSVLVPAQPPAPWELTDIPHGRLDHYLYETHVAKNLRANQEPYVVYTPPGYDAKRKGGYPVLYLLHGWSDTENGWTAVGHADYILDTLLAEGKIMPMIVVMPQGYGDLDFVTHGERVWSDPATVSENVDLYSQMLLTEVLPAVEKSYNVAPGREHRAIAGLSMGGLESLTIGLNHPETFAYVGGMSAAVLGGNNGAFDREIPGADAKKANLRLLWVACGKTDGLFSDNQTFIAWAKTKGFEPVTVETEGAHTWLTWRDNLITLTPLLFRK
jgi:enterochelin esterase-like enzyme